MRGFFIRDSRLVWLARLPMLLAAALIISPLYAQEDNDWAFRNIIPSKHSGPVTAMFIMDGDIFSAGEDGFLEIWDIRTLAARERFQLSSYGIKSMVKRPGKDEICVLESDGMGIFIISVWDYRKREKIFSLRFKDQITYINYSYNGSFIITARTGRNGLLLVNPQTGEIIKSTGIPSTTINFAATGRSERFIASYFSVGLLSYTDLETGEETVRLEVSPNLTSVVMCNNNRYLCGIDSSGLAVLDAVSGNLLDRNASIPKDSLLFCSGDDLFCVVQGVNTPGIFRFTVDQNGRLRGRDFFSLTLESETITIFSVSGDLITLGSSEGRVLIPDRNGQTKALITDEQLHVICTAVSGSVIAFLTGDNYLGFLPLDYMEIIAGTSISLEKQENYSRISPVRDPMEGKGQFLLWQNTNTELLPRIVSAYRDQTPLSFNAVSLRFPLRSAHSAFGKLLLLDTAGNLSVFNSGERSSGVFTFYSSGSSDAGFINDKNIILCRTAILGNTPFLMLNIETSETVPLYWPSQAGIMSFTGDSGVVYAVTMDEEESNEEDTGSYGLKTSIIKLNTSAPSQSEILAFFQGEESLLSIAESEKVPAAIIGTEGAFVFGYGGAEPLARTPGLPVQLSGGGGYFIALDTEGNICWYEAQSRKLAAIFKIYGDWWILQAGNLIRSGTVNSEL